MTSPQKRLGVLATALLVVGACGQSAPAASVVPADIASTSSPPTATVSAPASAAASAPASAPAAGESPAVVQFAESTDPSAPAEREQELVRQLREDTGMAQLIGENGAAAFAELDAIEEQFAEQLIRDVAAEIDAGSIPKGSMNVPAACSHRLPTGTARQ